MAVNDVFPRRNLPGEAEEWGRTVESRIVGVESLSERTQQSLLGLNRSTASSLQDLAITISSIPITLTGFAREDGRGLSGGAWNLSTVINVPTGKNRVHVMSSVNAQFLDMTSGGAAVAYAQIEHNIGGLTDLAPKVSASKDHGASVVNNVLNASYVTGMDIAPGNPVIGSTVYFTSTNNVPYTNQAANFAVLNVLAIFSVA